MIPQPTHAGEVRRETGLDHPQPTGRRLRHAWRLVSGYWISGDWKFAWTALAVLLFFQFGAAYVLVAGNRWEQHFFDSVERRDAAAFGALIFVFLGILAMQVGMILIEGFVERLLSIRWRTYLTDSYLDRWMAGNRFNEIERLRMIDNPDQRIAEDLERITNSATGLLSMSLRIIGSVITGVSFAMILLETADPIRFTVFGTPISIPGSTVWYAVGFVLVSGWITTKIGQPFIRASMRQQHREADFRAALIHIRRNAPQIGLAGAVPVERLSLRQSFDEVRRNFRSIIYTSLGITAAQSVYERLVTVLPLFLLVPRYFAGGMGFGQLMGARDAFQRLTFSLGYFIQAFERIGLQVSYFNRVKGLDDAIDAYRPAGIALMAGPAGATVIATSALVLRRPQGERLCGIGDWTVRRGERWAVTGASGAGKSTLVRAIAGLWPDGTGSITVAEDIAAMFVPQRLYLPLGTLKAAVCFPDPPERHDDAAIVALMDAARLAHLAGDIHALRMWQDELSPGEQQRLALARILLHRPDMLVLDEATSALDADNARHVYDMVLRHLPGVTLVSVIHDPALLACHTDMLAIGDGPAVASRIDADD